ncbi:hypothetical protein LCGC14_2075750, partial [marine sediment metagenome]
MLSATHRATEQFLLSHKPQRNITMTDTKIKKIKDDKEPEATFSSKEQELIALYT